MLSKQKSMRVLNSHLRKLSTEELPGIKSSNDNKSDVASQFFAEMAPISANASVPKVPGMVAVASKAPINPRINRANTSYVSVATSKQPNEKTMDNASQSQWTPKNRMMEAFGKAMNLKIAAMMTAQKINEQGSLVRKDSREEFVDAIKQSQKKNEEKKQERREILAKSKCSDSEAFDAFFNMQVPLPDKLKRTQQTSSKLMTGSNPDLNKSDRSQKTDRNMRRQSSQMQFLYKNNYDKESHLFMTQQRMQRDRLSTVVSQTGCGDSVAPGGHSPVHFEPSPAMTRRNTTVPRGGNKNQLSTMNSMKLRKTFKQITIGKIDEEPNSTNSRINYQSQIRLDEKRASLLDGSDGSKSRKSFRQQSQLTLKSRTIEFSKEKYEGIKASAALVCKTDDQPAQQDDKWRAFLKPTMIAPFELKSAMQHAQELAREKRRRAYAAMKQKQKKKSEKNLKLQNLSKQQSQMRRAGSPKSQKSGMSKMNKSFRQKEHQSQGKLSNDVSQLRSATKNSREVLSTPSSDFNETSDDEDFVGSTSYDVSIGEDSVQNIFNNFVKKKVKKEPEPKKDEEEELAKELKLKLMDQQIELWKDTAKQLKLSEGVQKKIEKRMREEGEVHSKIIMLLTKMIDKYETLWPTGESRVPFFVQDFEMRKHRNKFEAMVTQRDRKGKLQFNNESFRSKRKPLNMSRMHSHQMSSQKFQFRQSGNQMSMRKMLSTMPQPLNRISEASLHHNNHSNTRSTFSKSMRFDLTGMSNQANQSNQKIKKSGDRLTVPGSITRGASVRISMDRNNESLMKSGWIESASKSPIKNHQAQQSLLNVLGSGDKMKLGLPQPGFAGRMSHQPQAQKNDELSKIQPPSAGLDEPQLLSLRTAEVDRQNSASRKSSNELVDLQLDVQGRSSYASKPTLFAIKQEPDSSKSSLIQKPPQPRAVVANPQVQSVSVYGADGVKVKTRGAAEKGSGFNQDLNQEVDLDKTRNKRMTKNKTIPIVSIGNAGDPGEDDASGKIMKPPNPEEAADARMKGQPKTSLRLYKTQNWLKEAPAPGTLPSDVNRQQSDGRHISSAKTVTSMKNPVNSHRNVVTSQSVANLALPRKFVKSIVKQMKRQQTHPESLYAVPKVVMESELVNPLNRQLRRLKRRGSQQLGESKKSDKQLESLVLKLQEKNISCCSPRSHERVLTTQKSASIKHTKPDEAITALSTQKSIKCDTMTESQSVVARMAGSTVNPNNFMSTQQQFSAFHSSRSRQQEQHGASQRLSTANSARQKKPKMKRLKHSGKGRREAYLNLIQQKYLNQVKEGAQVENPVATVLSEEVEREPEQTGPQSITECTQRTPFSALGLALGQAAEQKKKQDDLVVETSDTRTPEPRIDLKFVQDSNTSDYQRENGGETIEQDDVAELVGKNYPSKLQQHTLPRLKVLKKGITESAALSEIKQIKKMQQSHVPRKKLTKNHTAHNPIEYEFKDSYNLRQGSQPLNQSNYASRKSKNTIRSKLTAILTSPSEQKNRMTNNNKTSFKPASDISTSVGTLPPQKNSLRTRSAEPKEETTTKKLPSRYSKSKLIPISSPPKQQESATQESETAKKQKAMDKKLARLRARRLVKMNTPTDNDFSVKKQTTLNWEDYKSRKEQQKKNCETEVIAEAEEEKQNNQE